ncbi:Flagellar motor switch protein FliN [Clostridium sp. N3C]|uniref:flagellar motor switch phosphatase FliY n=1 Tax=Clostridium sp. N3C TaxID=1776758 RepID=UPI00092DF5C4|nr:flagellar motor switch phosphatase FliY [Clostridium sp. N3C]SCN21279.1 Flagellar motor switch protein FliN [Clostridium sp. N3C]
MSNGFLSQEEIDALLNGGDSSSAPQEEEEILSDVEKDLLGEVGNISMGSASTALSQILNQAVNITTPVVTITTLDELSKTFQVPNLALEVKYTSGIIGGNLLVMKITDAAIIASLMMGGDGKVSATELTEIEESAVAEAMNQMIGSAATSMATMLAREVNISPPVSMIWTGNSDIAINNIDTSEKIVRISFSLTVGDLIDSTIMQILPIETAKKIVSIMMGQEDSEMNNNTSTPVSQGSSTQENYSTSQPQYNNKNQNYNQNQVSNQYSNLGYQNNYGSNNFDIGQKPIEQGPPIEVQKAQFQPLHPSGEHDHPKNIDLILDVPLEISVVLGRTKKSIKDVLALGTGSLVELDKLAEEPVEILVNGKKVAYGEVVVVDENFGVRITSIVSNAERIKSLGK